MRVLILIAGKSLVHPLTKDEIGDEFKLGFLFLKFTLDNYYF